MNKSRKMIVMCIVSMAMAVTAMAQDKLSLSVDEAMDYALKHNLAMQNADLAIREADRRIWETTAQGLPQIDAVADYSNFLGAEMSFSFGEGLPSMSRKFEPTANAQLTVGQLLFSGSYIVGVQTARLFKSLTELQYQRSELEIKEAITKAYYLALMAERSKDIVGKNLVNLRDVFSRTETMVRVGIADKFDLDQLSVQISLVEQSLKSAERQSELSYNLLRIQLGVNAETEIELTDSLEKILENRAQDTAINRQDTDMADNLDIQLMKSQEVIAEKQVDLERMRYLPTITGFYSHTNKIIKPEFDLSPKNVIGVRATIPIFSSGMRRSRVDQANIRLQAQRNTTTLLMEQLSIQEKQLRFNLTNAKELYEIQKRNIEVSRNVYENFNRKYQHGLASSLDLTTANSNYLQAESGYISAMLQLLEAETALSKLYNSL